MDKAIGGYFEWEFPSKENFPHCDGILLNSEHHAIQFIFSIIKPRKVYIPYYTCDSVEMSLKSISVDYEFYKINEFLEIQSEPTLESNDYLIYTNYFGIKDKYVSKLSEKYGFQLVIDNAQAFYVSDSPNSYQVYSPRKFVGCPDGGIIYPIISNNFKDLQRSKSYNRCKALLQRRDGEITLGYHSFHECEGALYGEDVMQMSQLTQCILSSINHDDIVKKRRRNFLYLHSKLGKYNTLSCVIGDDCACPLVYPYYTDDPSLRNKLIEKNVFVAQYWPNVFELCNDSDLEWKMAKHIIPLPIDQRYDIDDMERIVRIIRNECNN